MIWNAWQEDWLLYHKVVFDGINKQIIVAPSTTTLSVKIDLYSDWKEWSLLRDNAKFLPAMRTIGGDPVGGGLYAGDMYFLMNGWQLVVDHFVAISGILYHDDGISPFIIQPGGGITSTVSSLAYAYNTTGSATPPTVQEIRAEIDTNSAQLAAIKANVANVQITADTILGLTV